jgi:hypothetical protein
VPRFEPRTFRIRCRCAEDWTAILGAVKFWTSLFVALVAYQSFVNSNRVLVTVGLHIQYYVCIWKRWAMSWMTGAKLQIHRFENFFIPGNWKVAECTRLIITKFRLMKNYKYLRPKKKSSKLDRPRSKIARFENSKPNILIHTRHKERHGTSSNAMDRPI